MAQLDLGKMLAPMLFPVALMGGISLIIPLTIILIKRARMRKTKDFINLSPSDFVNFVAMVYRNHGFTATITEGLNDKGADLVLKKDGKRIAVQVKHWKKPVGMSAVREVVAAIPHYRANQAIVVCSRSFTARAIDLASDNRVLLVDGMHLAKLRQNPPARRT